MKCLVKQTIFFSMWVFFHEHSRFTGHYGEWEAISLTPLYHLQPLHRHLNISQVITAERSPLHIASRRTQTGNLWFLSALLTTKLRALMVLVAFRFLGKMVNNGIFFPICQYISRLFYFCQSDIIG